MSLPNGSQEDSTKALIAQLLQDFLATLEPIPEIFARFHDADIAEALEELLDDGRRAFFEHHLPDMSFKVFEALTVHNQLRLIQGIQSVLASQIIREMDSDNAADLLEALLHEDDQKAHDIILLLPKRLARDLKKLLSYREDSAGALMTSEYVAVLETLTIKEAIEYIRRAQPPNSEISFYIFIIDKTKKLLGYTTLRNIVLADPSQVVRDIRNDYPVTVDVDLDQEEVAKLFQKYDVMAVPVVDSMSNLVGVITVDDIVDVVIEEATEDIYKLSGTTDIEESTLLSGRLIYVLQSRLPWLIITIFGGLLSSYVISMYSSHYKVSLFTLAISLSFMPLLTGLGGNVGNQTATIIVRGLSTGLVKTKTPFRYIVREVLVGFNIGIIMSLLVFVFSLLSVKSILFSVIVSLALLFNISFATFIGAALPILFKRINIDPAVASAPFLSTSLDIAGQLIYFGLTFWIVSMIS